MTVQEAYGRLAAVPHDQRPEILDWELHLELPRGPFDVWPAGAVAAAALGVGLECIGTAGELLDAVRHYSGLADVLDAGEWEKETKRVLAEVLAAGQRLDRELAKRAASN